MNRGRRAVKHRVVYRSDCAGAEKKDGCGCGGNADNMGKKKVKSILRKKKFVVAEYIPPFNCNFRCGCRKCEEPAKCCEDDFIYSCTWEKQCCSQPMCNSCTRTSCDC